MLLCGDAAGQTDPLTGAGVYNAVVCGQMAGEAVAQAVRQGKEGRIFKYEESWRSLFEKRLSEALTFRQRLAACSAADYGGIVLEAWGVRRGT